jgi:glycerol uptake facilitator-like aquaporin
VTGAVTLRYIAAQIGGAILGVAAADLTYGNQAFVISANERSGVGLVAAEAVATFVLVIVILALVRTGRAAAVPAAVGAWVSAAIFATASTSFANPAVTVGRMFTDTYTGIHPSSVGGFVVAQVVAGFAAAALAPTLFPRPGSRPVPD